MRALDLIVRKRNGGTLTRDEIAFLIRGYTGGDIPEYQVAAFLMAVYFKGLDAAETGALTEAMIGSGDRYSLEGLKGPFVDKHSTGGVGDKVSLILAPMAAALGISVPMMSGRSLGHTGGTLDKLEAIPGYKTAIDEAAFVDIIRKCGFAMTGQSARIVPADRLLYALRDVTGTVESIPLITSSILSKKFAEGADALVFDVKFGSGAFMKSLDDARALAASLQRTGKALDRKVVCVLSDMNEVLGSLVGNFVEAEESYNCLLPDSKLWQAAAGAIGSNSDAATGGDGAGGAGGKGRATLYSGPCGRLMELTVRLTAWMAVCAGTHGTVEEGEAAALETLRSGRALELFEKNLELQGGDLAEFKARLGSWRAPVAGSIKADRNGYVADIDPYDIGMAGVYLGAGRSKTDDKVYPDVGIEVVRPRGSQVKAGDEILRYWARDRETAASAEARMLQAVKLQDSAPAANPAIAMEMPAL